MARQDGPARPPGRPAAWLPGRPAARPPGSLATQPPIPHHRYPPQTLTQCIANVELM